MASRKTYLVDTDRLTEHERIDACRELLELVAPHVTEFETDIPWSTSGDWPVEVREAAEHWSSLRKPRRGETDAYRQTGMRTNDDPVVWNSFVTFAPYSFDASAWSRDAGQLVALADCADSIVVRLTDEQVALACPLVQGHLKLTKR